MKQSIIFWCYVVATLNSGLTSSDKTRLKRVIHGKPVLTFKNSDYRVLQYYVWIGNGHNCDLPVPAAVKNTLGLSPNWEIGAIRTYPYWVVGRICEPRPNHLWCTGSLLNEFLVQTACHCVTYFNEKDDKDEYIYPVLMKPEEVGFTVHPARRLVSDYKVNEGVYTRNFVMHPKCMKKQGYIFHDYALIYLHSSFWKYQHSYAPIYPAAELARMWLDAMAMAKVCLIMGFGTYSWVNGKRFVDENLVKSDVLRHGWSQVMSYGECYEKFPGIGRENFTRWATIICAATIPSKSEEVVGAGKGDSGGPVTCDNEYIGLVSAKRYSTVGFGELLRFVSLDKPMSTAFSIYENAAEYRAQLVSRIFELYGPNDPKKDFIVTQQPLRLIEIGEIAASRAHSMKGFCFLTFLLFVIIIGIGFN